MQNVNIGSQILYKSNTELINQKTKLTKVKKIFLLSLNKYTIILLFSFFSLYILI